MLDDMFEIALDPIFPPKNPKKDSRPNDFELIYSEQGAARSDKPFCMRSPFSNSVYPIKALEQVSRKSRAPNFPSADSKGVEGGELPSPQITATERANQTTYVNFVNNIESLCKSLHAHLNFKTSKALVDTGNLITQINKVLHVLEKPELLSPIQLKIACRSIDIVSRSIGQIVLTEHEIVRKIAALLNSQQVHKEIIHVLVIKLLSLPTNNLHNSHS